MSNEGTSINDIPIIFNLDVAYHDYVFLSNDYALTSDIGAITTLCTYPYIELLDSIFINVSASIQFTSPEIIDSIIINLKKNLE